MIHLFSPMLGAAGPVSPWAVAPFVLLLLVIAVFPLLPRVNHWWEHNRNRFLIAAALGAATLAYYLWRGTGFHGAAPGWPSVVHVIDYALAREYVPFMVLLFSLYVISGGIVLRGDLRATPLTNTSFLLVGALLANLIGTTGASMVLIRPVLRTNSERRHVVHTVVFFIFLVSNVGGCLTPVGDPPLFLGYLNGVPFFWTLRLIPEWAFMTGLLLAVYFVWDTLAYRREPAEALAADTAERRPLQLVGGINWIWLLGAVLAVILLNPGRPVPGTSWTPPRLLREGAQLAFVVLSLATTPRGLRAENRFGYHAIIEVAALFIGIFVTMQPALELLHSTGPWLAERGFTHPWQFFWATGVLSSVLDNAPTYQVFFKTATTLAQPGAPGALPLASGEFVDEALLAAISCGAVFMGANTYIGNGPNFMVRAIAEQSGVRMPSFFGYAAYALVILIPLFVLVTFVFFRS